MVEKFKLDEDKEGKVVDPSHYRATMDMTIDQQVALDEALVPHESRLRIGKSNFRFRSDITSKESTLQLVYDVLKLTPFYTAEMLHICPRIPNKLFDELHFKEEILAFLRNLGHSGEIKKITEVNINKLHQPWRSFVAVINMCLSGKSTSYDSLRLSQAQILWGMYHKKNVDFSYLLWEEFVYQVKHKDSKKSNEMYYPRFTKVIVNFFMTKDLSIPRRNKVNWHCVRDDQMFTTIKIVSKHQNTQQFEPPKTKASVEKTQSSSDTTMPPPVAKGTRLQTSARVDKAAKGKQPDKSGADEGTGLIPGVPDVPTYESDEEISWKSSDEDDDDQDDEDDVQTDSDNDGDDFVHPKFFTHNEEAKDEESFDPIVQTPSHVENSDDEGNDDASHGMNVGGDEGPDTKDDNNELYGDLNINLEGRDVQMTDVHTTQVLEDTHVTLTPVNPDGQQQSSSVLSQFVSNMLNPSPDTGIESLFESTPRMDVPVMTTVKSFLLAAPTLPPASIPIISQVQQTLEANFSEFMQTNQFVEAVSFIPGIVDRYLDHQMNEAIKVAIQLQSDKLRDEAQAKNEDFLNKLDENIQNIITEHVKEQVKVQVSKILPKIKKTINEQLKAEVLTRASNSANISYVVAADLSELELKKILIKKMESNKSIHRSDQQKNLYKAPVDAYECDKIILDIYEDTVTLKRRRDDEDNDEEPSAGSDRGSKRRRTGKEQESTSAPKEKASKTSGKSTKGSKAHQKTASKSATAEEPMQTTQDLEEPSHLEFETGAANDQPIIEAFQHLDWFPQQAKPPTPNRAWNTTLPATHGCIQPWIRDLAKQADSRTSFNERMDTPVDFLAFLMNWLKVDTLTPELLDGPTYELMKGSCKSLVELEFFLKEPLPLIPNPRGRRVIPLDHFINNDLEYLRGGPSNRKVKYRSAMINMLFREALIGGINVNNSMVLRSTGNLLEMYTPNVESSLSPNFKSSNGITIKHLDWITVHRDDDKLYKFKEGDLKRLRIQDIKYMLLLLV
nr:hypothetical protein [Tanacetum cinerariifolium]